MKTPINTIRIATTALWPIIFLGIIGYMELHFGIRVALSFQPYALLPLIPIYIFSGCIFAFNVSCGKEFIRQRIAVCAHVFSAISVTLFSLFWVLRFLGIISIDQTIGVSVLQTIGVGASRVPLGVFSLILGFTMFTAIRAIALYKKAVV